MTLRKTGAGCTHDASPIVKTFVTSLPGYVMDGRDSLRIKPAQPPGIRKIILDVADRLVYIPTALLG
jgi:hypothetical protein